MSQSAATQAMALSDRYFVFEPWLIGSLFAASTGLAVYLVVFLATL